MLKWLSRQGKQLLGGISRIGKGLYGKVRRTALKAFDKGKELFGGAKELYKRGKQVYNSVKGAINTAMGNSAVKETVNMALDFIPYGQQAKQWVQGADKGLSKADHLLHQFVPQGENVADRAHAILRNARSGKEFGKSVIEQYSNMVNHGDFRKINNKLYGQKWTP